MKCFLLIVCFVNSSLEVTSRVVLTSEQISTAYFVNIISLYVYMSPMLGNGLVKTFQRKREHNIRIILAIFCAVGFVSKESAQLIFLRTHVIFLFRLAVAFGIEPETLGRKIRSNNMVTINDY
jgi:hypothetical protein